MERTQVVVIGGGCTGTGILRDLALRGIPAVLFEKQDLAYGTTGRCHGLLHSGARYSVKDLEAAKECIAENTVLKKIAANCIEDTGGMFVHLQEDDAEYVKQFVSGCKKAGIETEELSPQQVLEREPNVTTKITRAFTVPDAYIDVFQLTTANAQDAVRLGATVKTYTQVTNVEVKNRKVQGIHFIDNLTGEEDYVACDVVVNAAGPWGALVAAQLGIEVNLVCNRGSLVIFNQRITRGVVNRLKVPGDCDLIVPGGPVSILGTTSINVSHPENLAINPGEIDHMLGLAGVTFPGLSQARIIRAFSGVRPLYSPKAAAVGGGREISRNYVLLDHECEDKIGGFVSILGGKLTTYRLMAEVTTDLVCRKLGVDKECTTAKLPLRAAAENSSLVEGQNLLPLPALEKVKHRLGNDLSLLLERIKKDPLQAEILCECEFVTRAELELALEGVITIPARTISDLARRTRLGLGTCQGNFCGYKAMITVYEKGIWQGEQAKSELKKFLRDRWKGQEVVAQGKQTQQLFLSHHLYDEALSGAHLGEGTAR
ncbi:Anaerobic glycerol-3-phosphate dehydrogenase subunit A [Sporomusa silvacetica DSM 10669]|uniref:Anaerobic glycerol-3-phosphate dehydrogenase subunit A n=1 Tax=Sporomusa silvacetica DSM 10669 TaxID=1123289 RepID=A0ABZ3IQD6_9FIRM|nr:anaerobic glycerol-3-phosphate dehydrogenase subunit GlpA [Sporomusa silvacetica]OZC16280.1 anaerobic glycerol-3-phosphate dehydrogenase subunit A [Sporomusa silvacetica DSM 10669]